jgi:hypothetical protein
LVGKAVVPSGVLELRAGTTPRDCGFTPTKLLIF